MQKCPPIEVTAAAWAPAAFRRPIRAANMLGLALGLPSVRLRDMVAHVGMRDGAFEPGAGG